MNETTKQAAPDGRYILFPEGGSWEYRRIRHGICVRVTEESNMATHEAGRDDLAYLAQLDLDTLPEVTDAVECRAILDACDRQKTWLEGCVITRISDDAIAKAKGEG